LIQANRLDIDVLLTDAKEWLGDESPEVNDLIYAALNRVAQRFLGQIPSRARLHASTLDYNIYTNCMDSCLCFEDERIGELYEDWRRS
jgi:hypothetical protein